MNQSHQCAGHSSVAEKAVNLHLERLSDLQKQLGGPGPPGLCSAGSTGSCICQQVPGHAAALQEAAGAHGPLDASLLLRIIKLLGSVAWVLTHGFHTASAHAAAIQALHRSAIIPAQKTMPQFVYKTHYSLGSYCSSEAEALSEMPQGPGTENLSQSRLMATELRDTLGSVRQDGLCGATQVLAVAHMRSMEEFKKQLCRLKTLQTLARSTQQQTYTLQGQQLAASLIQECAAAHSRCQALNCMCSWATEALAVWPHVGPAMFGAVGSLNPYHYNMAAFAAAQLHFLSLLGQVSSKSAQDIIPHMTGAAASNDSQSGSPGSSSQASTSNVAINNSSSGKSALLHWGCCSSLSGGGAASANSSTSDQLPALDVHIVAQYRSLLSSMLGMMSSGLCFGQAFNTTDDTGALLSTFTGCDPKSRSDRFLLLSLTSINHFGSQLLDMFEQQQSSKETQGQHACHKVAAGVSASSSGGEGYSSGGGGGDSGSGCCSGGNSDSIDYGNRSGSSSGLDDRNASSRHSNSNALDPWEAAEALLLCRADMMQSEAESAAHLAPMLRQASKVFMQHWQQLGYPVCLHPLSCSEPATTDTASVSRRAGSSSNDSSSSVDGSTGSSGSSGKDSSSSADGSTGSSGSTGSTGSSGNYSSSRDDGSTSSSSHCLGGSTAAADEGLHPVLLGLLDAVHLLLDVMLHKSDPPALRLHASATSQLLLSAAAAALALYGSTAAYVADKCLTATIALLWSQPCGTSMEAAVQQAQDYFTACTLDPLLHKLQQGHVPRQHPPQQAGSAVQPPTYDATARRQTMGLLMHVLQQLRFALDKEQARTHICSTYACPPSITGSGSSSVHSSSVGSSSCCRRSGCNNGSCSVSSFAQDNVLRCMLKSFALVAYHHAPLLSPEQLDETLQLPQHCEQLAAVYQETEATLRVLSPLLRDKQNSQLEDVSPQPSVVGDPYLSPVSVMIAMVSSLVNQSGRLLQPTAAQQNQLAQKDAQLLQQQKHKRHVNKQQQQLQDPKQQQDQQQQQQQQEGSAHHQQKEVDGWHVLSGTVHGQQLLQAWLSLMLTVDKSYSVMINPKVEGGHKDFDCYTKSGRTVHQLLMAHVVQDLQAYTRNSRHHAMPQQQQQQHQELQRQQVESGDCSSAGARHLPHPQLVNATLNLAKHHYGRFTTTADAEPAAAATAASTATAGGASSSSSKACCADAKCSCIGDRLFTIHVAYDDSVRSLSTALGQFAAAPLLGQQPATSAWRVVLGMPDYVAGLSALEMGVKVYVLGRNRFQAYSCHVDQLRKAMLLDMQDLEEAIRADLVKAGAAAGVQISQQQQQQQQQQQPKSSEGGASAQLAASQQAAQLPRTSSKQAERHKARQRAAAAVVQLPGGASIPVTVFDACCFGAGQLGKLLSALAPSRHTCSGPLCRSLATVSESFALVRGRGFVCGCCVARSPAGNLREAAFRFCSPECQLAAWPMHQALSKRVAEQS